MLKNMFFETVLVLENISELMFQIIPKVTKIA